MTTIVATRHDIAGSTAKRAVDVTLASLALVLLSPVMAAAWLAVRCTSRGPGLFSQERVGLHGEPFTIYKFRSMRVDGDDSEHRAHAVALIVDPDAERTDNGTFKLTDCRVTRVGKLIRATSIDELPQLWNVVRGDMSLVGPRPMLDYEDEHVTGRHRERTNARPGMTGLWQVSGRSDISTREMLDLDVQYVEEWSFVRDVVILLKTPLALVGR